MSLQDKITQDMRNAMKGSDKARLSILRFIVGEFTHIDSKELEKYPGKKLSNEKVVSIIRKCLRNENSLANPDPKTVEILESYLPAVTETPVSLVSDTEILAWIQANIDFTAYKNRMQAMKPIMAEFAGRAEGKQVKMLLENME